jgi:hypothetical protein
VLLREQLRKVDRGTYGPKQGVCDTEYEVVRNQCGVGGHRIKDRVQEVTGIELIRENVRVVCGEPGEGRPATSDSAYCCADEPSVSVPVAASDPVVRRTVPEAKMRNRTKLAMC